MNQSQNKNTQHSESLGDRRRKELFELYSNNLNLVKRHPRIHLEPDADEGFICPICFGFFTSDALSKSSDNPLSLEDVPPISLGGRVRTITCKSCNNWAGGQLEGHLKHKLIMDEFIHGFSSSWEYASFQPKPNINIPTTVYIVGESGIYIEAHPNRSNPEDLDKFRSLAESQQIPEFNLNFIGKYKKHRPEAALLRIAYLWAFSFFGYGFLINFNLQHIRHQILNPTDKILPNWGIAQMDFPDDILGINIVSEPKELRSFLVVFDLKTKNRITRHGVILPGPSFPGLSIYKWLSELPNDGIDSQLRAINIPKNNYIVDRKLVFAPLEMWNELLEET